MNENSSTGAWCRRLWNQTDLDCVIHKLCEIGQVSVLVSLGCCHKNTVDHVAYNQRTLQFRD